MKQSEAVKVDATKFELKLPEPFNQKPWKEVALPSNCTALIYEDMVWATKPGDSNDGKGRVEKLVPGWRIIIVNKHGRTPQAIKVYYNDRYIDRHGGGDSHFSTDDALSVQFWLKRMSFVLTKKSKTTTVDEDPED